MKFRNRETLRRYAFVHLVNTMTSMITVRYHLRELLTQVSADYGILIAETSRNPSKVCGNKKDAVAPDLCHWSDIAFLA
jgi:hypothetical protein